MLLSYAHTFLYFFLISDLNFSFSSLNKFFSFRIKGNNIYHRKIGYVGFTNVFCVSSMDFLELKLNNRVLATFYLIFLPHGIDDTVRNITITKEKIIFYKKCYSTSSHIFHITRESEDEQKLPSKET